MHDGQRQTFACVCVQFRSLGRRIKLPAVVLIQGERKDDSKLHEPVAAWLHTTSAAKGKSPRRHPCALAKDSIRLSGPRGAELVFCLPVLVRSNTHDGHTDSHSFALCG
jgi:hypothetical protein